MRIQCNFMGHSVIILVNQKYNFVLKFKILTVSILSFTELLKPGLALIVQQGFIFFSPFSSHTSGRVRAVL